VTGRLIIGDALAELRKLEAESVHCCISSPPYWGLRDYGAAGQLGLEKTPEQHVGAMVAVFEEVRRVLRSDGTLWLNYGDCYMSQPAGNRTPSGISQHGKREDFAAINPTPKRFPGLKPKDLVGMPWRVAFALQAAGWYLRSDIIWHKPNPMPESVTDRPTSAHEYLFLLAKSPRYFYDADAIREQGRAEGSHGHGKGRAAIPNRQDNDREIMPTNPAGRNKRSVWTVATQPYSGAHFATFPPKLITPCIMAGTSERGCCSSCGAPWVRVVEKGEAIGQQKGRDKSDGSCLRNDAEAWAGRIGEGKSRTTTGWRPSCKCTGAPHADPLDDAPVVPCTVLDPFGGSGTVAEVCEALGRWWVLIELNPDYEPLIRQRTAQRGLFSR
jgi:DNA modification methylase